MRRELREEDAEAVAALFLEGHGEARRLDADEIRAWLANESLLHENLLVLERDRVPYAYFDLWFQPDGTCDLDVAAPHAWDEAYAEAEAIAAGRGAARVRAFAPEGSLAGPILRRRGYHVVRATWTMETELAGAPPSALVPPGIEIRAYRDPEDELRTFEAHEEAFADHWGHHPQPLEQWREFTIRAREFDPTLWFLGWDGDEVAGYALNAFERPADPGYGWVGTLGVRRRWRRRGLGEALLRHSFAALHARGQTRVRLTVDSENETGAVRLYERVGMHVLRRQDTWERAV